MDIDKTNYSKLLEDVGKLLDNARKKAYIQVNNILIETYWNIGKNIIEFEQKGNKRAEYGSKLFDKLSKDLKEKYGTGFSRSNLIYIRLLYIKYPKSETLSHQLTWSSYFELLKIQNDLERNFYEKQCLNEKWSVRELKRQIKSGLFQRLAVSKNKKEILELSKNGQIITETKDIIKEPYILEFLGLENKNIFSEKELESKIIEKLEYFLLELGKGFTFVKRQFRMSIANKHFYIDLVFYHRILKCFILIDLKIDEVSHADVGQMNMYLNYFKKEEMVEGDNEPIGIILCAKKDEIEVEYAIGGLSNKLFVSKYELYLPKKEELEEEVRKLIEEER